MLDNIFGRNSPNSLLVKRLILLETDGMETHIIRREDTVAGAEGWIQDCAAGRAVAFQEPSVEVSRFLCRMATLLA